jgi:hypothetical protein
MATLDSIVNVQISRETDTVDRASFGIPLFLTTVAAVTDRVKTYANMEGVAADYADTETAYKMAQAAFSQEIRPNVVKIANKTAAETYTVALNAVVAADNDWYGLAIESIAAADIFEVATWTEARTKLFVARSADADIITNVTDDVASDLEAANFDRTALMYHPAAVSAYIDAAWLGNCLVLDPGSETWKFKTLGGIPVYTLTESQRQYALGKGANVYQRIAGVNITENGTVASGEYIDVMRGIDWLKARMQERIYSRLINAPKIPFTNAGIAVIEAAVRQQLDIAQAAGLIAPEPPYSVEVPDVLATDEMDRQRRELRGIKFRARLAGAIHYVEIRGAVYA